MSQWKPCSWRHGPPDEAILDTHLMARNLHCSGATVAWRVMLVMLHGVTGGPATLRCLEIWCPVYGHATQRGWGYTLQYCSQDNSRASTDRGSLTHYMCGGAIDGTFKPLCPHDLCLWPRWPSSVNFSYSANFWLHYSDNTNSAFFHYSLPNRIRIEYSVQHGSILVSIFA